MHPNDFRNFAYSIITLGCVLSFAAAIVPFFDDGYHLIASVLFVWLLPYIIYGIFTDLVRGWALVVTGVLILGIDVAVIVPERYLHYTGYTDGVVYYAALMATVLAAVILGIGARREQRWCGEKPSLPDDPATSPMP